MLVARYIEDVVTKFERFGMDGRALGRLETPGLGSASLSTADDRVEAFISMRLTLHEATAPIFRATLVNAARHPRIREELTRQRNAMRQQFERQFEAELRGRKPDQRESIAAAGDLLTQLESLDYLRRHRQLSAAEVHSALTAGLLALLD